MHIFDCWKTAYDENYEYDNEDFDRKKRRVK